MSTIPALALLSALLVSMVAPFASDTPGVSDDALAGVARHTLSVVATPGAPIPCQPPPPATPSPTPARDSSSFLDPTPTPAPDPDAVVDPRLDAMTAAAATALEACWNASDWNAVASILTPRFLQTSLGIDTPQKAEQVQALADLELGPLHIETIGPVGIWSDGRGAVEVLYFRGRGNPVQAVAARWFLIAERGVVRFDEEVLLLPPPLGDRITVGFAIADDQQPMQWNDPAGGEILRLTGDRAPRREPGLGVPYVSIGRNRWRYARRSHSPTLAPGRPRAARSPRWNLPPARPGRAWIGAVFGGQPVIGCGTAGDALTGDRPSIRSCCLGDRRSGGTMRA